MVTPLYKYLPYSVNAQKLGVASHHCPYGVLKPVERLVVQRDARKEFGSSIWFATISKRMQLRSLAQRALVVQREVGREVKADALSLQHQRVEVEVREKNLNLVCTALDRLSPLLLSSHPDKQITRIKAMVLVIPTVFFH